MPPNLNWYNRDKEKELARIETELATTMKRLSNIQTLMMDGELEAVDYRAMKAKLEPEIERSEREKRRLAEHDNSDKRKFIEHGFNFLRNLPELFTSVDLEGKHRFLGSTFPQKMVFENGEVRTSEMHPILMLMDKSNKALSDQKSKAPDCSGALTKKAPPMVQISNRFLDDLKRLAI